LGDPVAEEDRGDIQGVLAGDEEAFARIVRRYQAVIAAQMRRFSRDPADVEELVQCVFIEAYGSLANFRGRAPLLHWLRRIATRVGYRFWKQEGRERRGRASLAARRETPAPLAEPPGPGEAARLLHGLLGRLPPAERLVLTLHYFEGCSTREIAERTGWSRAWVKVRAFRARRRLRSWLIEAGWGG
jgi:RNA polymerase sigma-70 factor (ECF subfamily)